MSGKATDVVYSEGSGDRPCRGTPASALTKCKRTLVSESDRGNGRLATLTASKFQRPEMIGMADRFTMAGECAVGQKNLACEHMGGTEHEARRRDGALYASAEPNSNLPCLARTAHAGVARMVAAEVCGRRRDRAGIP